MGNGIPSRNETIIFALALMQSKSKIGKLVLDMYYFISLYDLK
jgi:hypothetical protein